MTKKIYIQQKHPELSVVNTETGEIISGVATTKVETIDEFIMIFLLNIQDAFKLEGQHLKILMCCWKYSSFNPSSPEGNRVTNNQALKNKIRESGLEVSDTVINNAFTAFVKNDLMIKECRGQYMLNPKYFFKGTLSNRSKLKLNIEN